MAHSAQLKAAVMAALLSGATAHQVARQFGLSRTTVRRWRDEAWSAAQQNGPQKRNLDEQLLGYIGESLEALRFQLRVMADADWLSRQPAHELARLHGVLFDRAARLLGPLRVT